MAGYFPYIYWDVIDIHLLNTDERQNLISNIQQMQILNFGLVFTNIQQMQILNIGLVTF